MPAHRGHAKRVARQRARRSALKKDLARAESLRSPQALLKRAHEFPVDKTWLSNAWRWADEPIPSLVTAVMTRRRGTTILLCMALLDRTCLGVKNGITRVATEDELDFILRQLSERNGPLELVDPDTFLSVVYHAVEFAQSLGFAPRSAATLSFFGPRPATLLDTPLAHPQRPVYVSGPYDDPAYVVAKLRQARGTEFDAIDGFYEEPLFVVDPSLGKQREVLLEGAAGFQGADDLEGTAGRSGAEGNG